ncbi:MAG: PP2C family serine/threonine-protein phosphatase [Roseiflexaceae bacterium]|jgi:serine/threonine protein phosphatase PrpC
MEWRIARASVIGTGHIQAHMPCQDSNYVMQVGDAVIIAVSDGLGSAAYSDRGSKFVCQYVVEHLAQAITPADPSIFSSIAQFVTGVTPHIDMRAIMINAATEARTALLALANSEQHDLRDYACTLLVAIMSPDEWHVLHIGDGAVVGITSATAVKTLSAPDNGEFINVTVPLTSSDYQQHLRYEHAKEQLFGIALLSDGVQPMCINYKTGDAYPGFFMPLINWLTAFPQAQLADASDGLCKLLDSDRLRQKSDDDMTLVLVITHNTSTGTQE